MSCNESLIDRMYEIDEIVEEYEELLRASYSFIRYHNLQEMFDEFVQHPRLIDDEAPLRNWAFIHR